MKREYLVIVNKDRDPDGVFQKSVDEILDGLGVSHNSLEEDREDKSYSAAIVLGGDGTIIRAADQLKGRGIPVFGINTGTIGYLAGAEKAEMKEALESLVAGYYITENRMMLDVSINGEYAATVLNDAVITRNGYSRIINLKVSVNGSELFTVQGDGIIVSTPTGSTGYNLSAGGTVCVPESKIILVTPICSHSMAARSIIAGSKDEITIEVPEDRYMGVEEIGLTMDGKVFMALKQGDSITVKKSKWTTDLIKTNNRTFYDTLKDKLY